MGIPFLTKFLMPRFLQVTTCQAKHPGGLGAIARDSDEPWSVVRDQRSALDSHCIWRIHFISLYTDTHCNIFLNILYDIWSTTLVLHVTVDGYGWKWRPAFSVVQSFKTDSVFSWNCQVLVVRALADAVEKSQASVGWVAWCDYRLDLNQRASIMRWQKRLQQGPAASKLWHGSLEGFGWFKWVSP